MSDRPTAAERRDALAGWHDAERDAHEAGEYLTVGVLQLLGTSHAYQLGYRAYTTDHPLHNLT